MRKTMAHRVAESQGAVMDTDAYQTGGDSGIWDV